MTDMEEILRRCDNVVIKWSQRTPTIEMAQDFAGVFGFQLNWTMTPAPVEELVAAPVDPAPQYEMFNEMSPEDKFAMKSWRSNNGL